MESDMIKIYATINDSQENTRTVILIWNASP